MRPAGRHAPSSAGKPWVGSPSRSCSCIQMKDRRSGVYIPKHSLTPCTKSSPREILGEGWIVFTRTVSSTMSGMPTSGRWSPSEVLGHHSWNLFDTVTRHKHDSGIVSCYFEVNAHRRSRVGALLDHRSLRPVSSYSLGGSSVESSKVCRPHARTLGREDGVATVRGFPGRSSP